MAKQAVLIVGGGFGGVKVALELADDPRFDITLISKHTDFRIYSTLYRTATGGSKDIASIPLVELLADKGVTLHHDIVVSLDRQAHTVTTEAKQTFSYNALVLALGVETNYFNIQGLEEFSYGIKTPKEAETFKRHLHKQLMDEGKPDLNYVVIGGGPTGVELAGMLPSYIRKISKAHKLPRRAIHVDLAEAAPRLLPRMPKDVSRAVARHLRSVGVQVHLNKKVEAQTADALMINGKPIRSHTVVWTAGVTNRPFFRDQGFQLAKNGRVRVDQFLQAEPGIYVVGDNADTPYSGMAQVAITDAEYVAENLKRLADHKEAQPYTAKKPIYVIPAGPSWAAVLWGSVRIYGRVGWWLRRAADFMAYRDFEPWYKAAGDWVSDRKSEDLCPTCNDKLDRQLYESGEV